MSNIILENILCADGTICIEKARTITPVNYADSDETIEHFTLALLVNTPLTEEFISTYLHRLYLPLVLTNSIVTDEFLMKHRHFLISQIMDELAYAQSEILQTLFSQSRSSEFYTDLINAVMIHVEAGKLGENTEDALTYLSTIVTNHCHYFPLDFIQENLNNELFALLSVAMKRPIEMGFLKKNIKHISLEEIMYYLQKFDDEALPDLAKEKMFTSENKNMLKELLHYKLESERQS